MNAHIIRPSQGNQIRSSPRRLALTVLAACMALVLAGPPAARAAGWYVGPHDVAAGNLTVSQIPDYSGDDNGNCSVALSLSVNDFRIGSKSRGDYNVQVGSDATDDSDLGVLISSVARMSRTQYGTNSYCTSAIETNSNGSYRITSYTHGPTLRQQSGVQCERGGRLVPLLELDRRSRPHRLHTPMALSDNLLTGSAGMKNWNDAAAYTNFWDL